MAIQIGDYISIFTNGIFEISQQIIPPVTATSGFYRSYSNLPNGYITKTTSPLYNNERELFDVMLTEVYNKHGVQLTYYIASYDSNYDRIFGEDNNRRFVRKFNFMAYYTLPREEKLWQKFGIQYMDTFSMYASKRHFRTASTYDYTQTSANSYPEYIPQIGDIIMSDYAKFVYEITEVKEEVGMYLQSKSHLWEFIVKPFRDEKISIPSDVSATMPEMQKYSDKQTDIYDTTQIINTKKVPINYVPKSNEKPSQNPPNLNW